MSREILFTFFHSVAVKYGVESQQTTELNSNVSLRMHRTSNIYTLSLESKGKAPKHNIYSTEIANASLRRVYSTRK